MGDFQKYIPLKQAVSYFLDQSDKSMGDFDKCWILAFRALVELNLDISNEPISVRLPVNGNKTVNLPPDYISWTKIGLLNNLGEVNTLSVNNALSIFKDTNPNRLSDLTADVQTSYNMIFGIPFFLNYFDNGLYYNLFGVGGGLITYGECRVDEKNGLIVLSPDFQYSEIILEYMSCPEKNGDYTIQIELQEAVIAFIGAKMKLNPMQDFYNEVIKGRRRLPGKKVTLSTINEVLRESTGFYLRS